MELILSLKDELSAVSDPRVLGRTRHNLMDVLILGVLAIICQAETWNDIEDFGHAKEEWLRKFLELPNGIPSHDTISRVFSLIEPTEFELAFISWMNQVRIDRGVGDTFCIDGKVVKGTIESNRGHGRKSLNIVSVWSTMQGLVLGQMRASGGGNAETSAAIELLNLLNIEGVTIVGDAGIGKPSVIDKILDKGGQYIFPIKTNTRPMYNKVDELFSKYKEKNSTSKKVTTHSIIEKGHGRHEERSATVIRLENLPENINTIESTGRTQINGLKAIGRIVYESKEKETRPFIQINGKYESPKNKLRTKKEVRYFVTSLNLDTKELMEKLRLQWSIESKLHWVLDVSLNEDGNRTRNKIAAENLSLVRKIALNLVNQDKKSKAGVKRKLKRCGWDNAYLEELLFKKSLG